MRPADKPVAAPDTEDIPVTLRRLPPPHDRDEKAYGARLAPKAIGLAIGLLLGYLLFPGSASEPAAAPAVISQR